LDLLHSVQHQGWKYIVTSDEARFYFSNQHEQVWLPDHEDPPTIDRQATSSPKTVLTVVWNPHGFHLAKIYCLETTLCLVPIRIIFGIVALMSFELEDICKRVRGSVGTCTLGVRMDLESITLYFHRKHLGAVAIHTEINSVLELGTIGCLRERSFLDSSSVAADEPEIEDPDAMDNAIRQALDEQHFASLR
jgi:hypothetical protein